MPTGTAISAASRNPAMMRKPLAQTSERKLSSLNSRYSLCATVVGFGRKYDEMKPPYESTAQIPMSTAKLSTPRTTTSVRGMARLGVR